MSTSGIPETFRVRVFVRPADHYDWDPARRVSTLYSTEVTVDYYQSLQWALAPVLRAVLPGSIPDEGTPSAEQLVGWAVRRRSVDPEHATFADYENPGLVWGVTDTGLLYGTHGLAGERSWMLGDVIAASRAGYDDHDWQDVLIWPSDGGRGGGGIWFDMISFLQQQGVTIEALGVESAKLAAVGAAGFYWRKIRGRFARGKRDRNARYLARIWETRNIGPYTLRVWFDSKRQWRVEEVSKRLQLHPFAAQELLIALGYAHKGEGVWALSERKKAKKRRSKWMKAEETEWLPEPY
jgi:hypothetical protein